MPTLRAFGPSDAEWVFRACRDPEVQRWTRVPSPYLLEHARGFVTDGVGSLAQWALVDDVGHGAGAVALHSLVDGAAEVGYWTAPWARRQGLATWAVAEVCRRGADLGASTVWGDVAQENTASQRVLVAAGFVVDPAVTVVATDGNRTAPADRWVRNLAELDRLIPDS